MTYATLVAREYRSVRRGADTPGAMWKQTPDVVLTQEQVVFQRIQAAKLARNLSIVVPWIVGIVAIVILSIALFPHVAGSSAHSAH